MYTSAMTNDAERRIATLEKHMLLLTARVAELEQAFAASAGKLTEIMQGVEELRLINKELARLNGVDLKAARKQPLQ